MHGRFILAALIVQLALSGSQQQNPAQTGAVFRGSAEIVPIDVHVTGKNGKPIAGLTAANFTVLEDGVPQKIQHFAETTITAQADAPIGPLVRNLGAGDTMAPQRQRVFLLVLGDGRLQGPAKGIDAMEQFVKQRLLPQDMAAVMGWNRATDFTNDHQALLRVLDEYKKRYEGIDLKVSESRRGLAGVYGDPNDYGPAQPDIDAIFHVAGGPDSRTVIAHDTSRTTADLTNDLRARTDTELRIQADRITPPTASAAGQDLASRSRNAFDIPLDLPFDEFAQRSSTSKSDVGRIMAGIDYLGAFEGEKHLVFVTAHGLYLPSADNDLSLAAVANTARVVIDAIHVGGIEAPPMDLRKGLGGVGQSATQAFTPTFTSFVAQTAMRSVSDLTGGVFSSSQSASSTFDRINASSGTSYLLGYSPAHPQDGRYRKIKVQVNVPGAQVTYRHGYLATEAGKFDGDRATSIMRLSAALMLTGNIRDIPLTIAANRSKAGPPQMTVDVTLPILRLAFVPRAEQYAATLDVYVSFGDEDQKTVGESWERVDAAVSSDDYTHRMDGRTFTYHANVALTGTPKYLKVVVYDHRADRLGSTMLTINPR